MRVGISGHQRLRDPGGWDWVRQEMRTCLTSLSEPLVGITSLSIGADTLFAHLVLELGGSLAVVVPFADYEARFVTEAARQDYRNLLGQAATIEVLEKKDTDDEGYYAAGKRVTDLSELLLVVWDGKPAAGLGGTADIAAYAHERNKEIVHLNPETRTVTP